MADTQESHSAAFTEAQEALTERLLGSTLGALELFSVHIGWRLGLYRELIAGPLTTVELADRAGIDGRYAQEWLEQQAAAGFLVVINSGFEGNDRRFELPDAHVAVLVDSDDPAHVAPFAPMIVGIGGALPDVVAAFRTGEGVPYTRYGADLRDGQGAINRPAFQLEMASWLAAVPGLPDRLSADPPAQIVDVGCGQGFSTVALAKAYPNSHVTGVDIDEASIADARQLADETGVNVTFTLLDADGLAASGPYDLACVFEALHDMGRPVEALKAMRRALTADGVLLIADERVADRFTAPGDEIERLMYGWSVSHCLPVSRVDEHSAALGTVLRSDTVRWLASEAGFANVDVLPIDNDFFRFYLLRQS